MSTLPSATTRMVVQSGAAATSTDLIAVWGCCATLADSTPRFYQTTADMLAAHGYCEALEYVALHMDGTNKPVLFMPLPISAAGTVGRFNASGNTGTSVVSCAVGGSGALAETDGVVTVLTGGTVGTDQIILGLSLDGGDTVKPVRLGTATSYVVPYVGLTVSLTVGTLIAGQTVLTWHSDAPSPDWTSLATALAAMKSQKKVTRSWLNVGDLTALNQASSIATTASSYETTAERYVLSKAQVRDRKPLATLSQIKARMIAASLTFLEVGATGDTITRATGSFLADGFVAGDTIRVTGSASNNVSGVPTTIAASVITLNTTDLVNEGPVAGVTVTSEPTLTFTDGGAGVDTIVRNRGSWLEDGFRVGDVITITGTATNNYSATVSAVTASTLTVPTATVTAEVIGSIGVIVTTGETASAHTAAMDAMFATVTANPRIDLGIRRLRVLSPITGYNMRRPVQWADSVRSYQNDISITTWWKELGPLKGWSIIGEDDERDVGGALAARFTCARTWGNGPDGAFIAQSLTRDVDGSILGMTHNAYVANLAQTVIQSVTEGWAGRTMVLRPKNVAGERLATSASLAVLSQKANEQLRRNLLTPVGGQGPRASVCKWTPSTTDDLGVPDATLNGVLELEVNGTLVKINTIGKVS